MIGKRIAYSTSLAQVTMMVAALEDENIVVYPIEQASHLSLAGADLGWYVSVCEDQAATAHTVLVVAGWGPCCLASVDQAPG